MAENATLARYFEDQAYLYDKHHEWLEKRKEEYDVRLPDKLTWKDHVRDTDIIPWAEPHTSAPWWRRVPADDPALRTRGLEWAISQFLPTGHPLITQARTEKDPEKAAALNEAILVALPGLETILEREKVFWADLGFELRHEVKAVTKQVSTSIAVLSTFEARINQFKECIGA